MARKKIDWEAVESDYRAGILSLREIGQAHDVSHVMVAKKAKDQGWTRDLNAKIQAKADALVNKAEVTAGLTAQRLATERQIVEAGAERIASVRIEHRKDIARARALVINLLGELEAETSCLDEFKRLGEYLAAPDDRGIDKLNEAYHKAISLPGRITSMKSLADALKTLVGLEREAYGIGADEKPPADDSTAPDKDALQRRILFMLAERLAGKQEKKT